MSQTVRSPVVAPAVAVVAVVLILAIALAIPLRRGATLGQAVGVFPQRVLWEIPIALFLPVVVALAARVRPRWIERPDPRPGDVTAGSLAALAETIRRGAGGRISRARVVARLVRLATSLAASRHGLDADAAWAAFLGDIADRDPETLSLFLGNDARGESAGDFALAVERALDVLEDYAKEG
ncbi:MAG: hypothetical protein AB1778_04415 [Candidatus Bipolaricaulota bacterium]